MNLLIKSVLLAKSITRNYPIVVVIRHCWKKKKKRKSIDPRAFEFYIMDKLQKISSNTSITSSNLQIER